MCLLAYEAHVFEVIAGNVRTTRYGAHRKEGRSKSRRVAEFTCPKFYHTILSLYSPLSMARRGMYLALR